MRSAFPRTEGCSEGLDAFRFFFKRDASVPSGSVRLKAFEMLFVLRRRWAAAISCASGDCTDEGRANKDRRGPSRHGSTDAAMRCLQQAICSPVSSQVTSVRVRLCHSSSHPPLERCLRGMQ